MVRRATDCQSGRAFCAAADVFLRIDIVLVRDRGCVSGPVFAALFNVQSGERFVDIATLTQFESLLDKKLLWPRIEETSDIVTRDSAAKSKMTMKHVPPTTNHKIR